MPSQQLQINDAIAVIKDFISIDYPHNHFNIQGTNDKIEDAMRAEANKRNLNSKLLDSILQVAADIVKLSFKGCTFEEKKNIALFTWYVIYVDDVCATNPASIIAFQQRLLYGLPQLDPVLDAFATLLHTIRSQYDDMFSNVLLSNTFEFINATVMETAMEACSAQPCSDRFPRFLRERTALGVSFATLIFPKSRSCDFLTFYQALPDMDFWIAAVNDLLSFYKEEIGGETATYIHNRANAERKDALGVLLAVKSEVREARENIIETLSENPAALAAWKAFEAGYIAFHLQSDRYKLKNLRL